MTDNYEGREDIVFASLAASEGSDSDTLRSLEEVKDSGAIVREYDEDGVLYAYREDDEHVVVCEDEDAEGTAETRRVVRMPAERWAVLPGERLWTIPENWVFRVGVEAGQLAEMIYRIPESGVAVVVSQSEADPISEAWYTVENVGTIIFRNNGFDGDRLPGYLSRTEKSEVDSEEVLAALEELYDKFNHFIDEYEGNIEDTFWTMFEGTTIEESRLGLYRDRIDTAEVIAEVVDADEAVIAEAAEQLHESGPIRQVGELVITVERRESIPGGYIPGSIPEEYKLRALVEAGHIRDKAGNEQSTEDDGESLATWAATCDVDQAVTRKKVREVQQYLDGHGPPTYIALDLERAIVGLVVMENDPISTELCQ